MHRVLAFFKNTFLNGALVVLPAWLAVLLFTKAVLQLQAVVKPVSTHLPQAVAHPWMVALALIIMACFLVGVAIRTAMGRTAKRALEKTVLEKVPGYGVMRNIAEQIGDMEHDHGFKPALVEVEEALVPGFIVEEHPAEGLCTVFIPSAPTPAAGSIYIIAKARVHPLDVSVAVMFKCITKWGAGSSELLAGMPKKIE